MGADARGNRTRVRRDAGDVEPGQAGDESGPGGVANPVSAFPVSCRRQAAADRVIYYAAVLSSRAQLARRSTPEAAAVWASVDLSIDQRIAARDPAGLHDAIVEAIGHLTSVRDELEAAVIGPAMRGSLAALAALKE